MNIQSTSLIRKSITRPSEVSTALAAGNTVSIDQTVLKQITATEALGLSNRLPESAKVEAVTLNLQIDPSNHKELAEVSALLGSLSEQYSKRAEAVKPKEKVPFLDIQKTATGIAIGAPVGLGIGVIAQELGKLGQSSSNPFLSAASVACTLVGAGAGAAVANGWIDIGYSGDKLRIGTNLSKR